MCSRWLQILMPSPIRNNETSSDASEEGLSKNPIRDLLLIDRDTVSAQAVTSIVAEGRDFFHTFIGQSIRRRYKRPAIYLVDTWVTQMLGLFWEKENVAILGAARGGYVSAPFPPMPGLFSVIDLFQVIHSIEEYLGGEVLVMISEHLDSIKKLAEKLIAAPETLGDLKTAASELFNTMHAAWLTLSTNEGLRQHISSTFGEDLRERFDRLDSAAQDVAQLNPEPLHGLSFTATRGSGLLLCSIPELTLEGPAIVLAPKRIREWATADLAPSLKGYVVPGFQLSRFGIIDRKNIPFAVGLCNVVQHEMMHALLALPNDPVQDELEMLNLRMKLYHDSPEIEEGLANFTAAVATAIMLMKAKHHVVGNQLPPLHSGKYANDLNELNNFLIATYADYHNEPTNKYFHAWRMNKCDYGAFAGFIKLFATNFGEIAWEEAFKKLGYGQIATGRGARGGDDNEQD